jgi:hypothetical protein
MRRTGRWLVLALIVVLSLAGCKNGPSTIYGTWVINPGPLDTLVVTTTTFTKTTFLGTGFVATIDSIDEAAGRMQITVTSGTLFSTGTWYVLYSIAGDDSLMIGYDTVGYPSSTTDGPYTRQ